uniref:RNA-directed DNA polymerase, eukaryota, reverse transcriptase zinc-binding domain protein n=1 Tax=Tanacetum cinerariifolium TaxID=118510 RepID=A0A699H3D9_TANCI|nr:hypothetical protein [Tanacetum cinerariifolium]
MEENGISKNQAFQKVYDEVYREELERISGMVLTKQLLLVKRLKAIKKQMRRPNKSNGNIFEKETTINEERLLKQKTKVEWLKEADSNSAYFHNVIKGRVSRNRIKVVYDGSKKAYYEDNVADQFVSYFSCFLGTCDYVLGIKDVDNLFTKKLDVESPVDLIKPITDEEFKEALFSIDDTKALGLDGYTSKFLMAA